MFDEERRHHHAYPVVHGAGLPELAHSCIDDGVAGSAALPCSQCILIATPRKGIEGRLKVARCDIRYIVQQMSTEFAPAQFAEKFFNAAGVSRIAIDSETRGVPDLSRADFTEPQMRR